MRAFQYLSGNNYCSTDFPWCWSYQSHAKPNFINIPGAFVWITQIVIACITYYTTLYEYHLPWYLKVKFGNSIWSRNIVYVTSLIEGNYWLLWGFLGSYQRRYTNVHWTFFHIRSLYDATMWIAKIENYVCIRVAKCLCTHKRVVLVFISRVAQQRGK